MPVERRTILFSGRVQGVGFRYTAVQLSTGLTLAGTVRNLDDGDVELIAEGESAEIDALVERLREHFGTFIRTIQQNRSRALGLPSGLHVAY